MVPELAVVLAAVIALGLSAVSLVSATVYLAGIVIPRRHATTAPTLILPVTGSNDLRAVLRLIKHQTLQPRRVILAVESERDPAFAAARVLADRVAFPIDVVVAGTSPLRGQKCTNLIAAARALTPDDRIIVMLDADIRPQRWWLTALIGPIDQGRADVVTGYRWQVIEKPSLATHLVALIDRSVALLPRLPWTKIVWGGSTAFSRAAFDAVDLPATLDRTLSDDLTLGNRVRALRLRLFMRRALLLPTPVAGTWSSLIAFGIRQCRIGRIYRPDLWWPMLLLLVLCVASHITLLIAAPQSRMAQIAIGLVALLGLGIALARDKVSRRIQAPDADGIFGVQALLTAFPLPVTAFFLGIVVASGLSRRVVWRHVDYLVRGPLDVVVSARRETRR